MTQPLFPSLGIVGLGRMAQALVLPLLEEGLLDPAGVRAQVGSLASVERLAPLFPWQVSTDPAPAWGQPVLLLAVKPQLLPEVAAVAAALPPPPPLAPGTRPLLISVLAGVGQARLQAAFPRWCCLRAVPNTPALVRQGLTGLSLPADLHPDLAARVRRLFAAVGEVVELPEAQLDPFLALTSSGPAFAALVVEALADGGVAAGLPRHLADHLSRRMLSGSLALLEQRQLHPAQLKDMVASPAGTTIAGLRRLEQAGLRSALIEAVLAATQRSRELG